MTTPNQDNTGCIDHEIGIQLECANCPSCFKGTKEICDKIRSQTAQTIYSGK